MKSTSKTILILDANVVIDLLQCNKFIFPLITKYIGQVVFATTILEEKKGLTADDCRELDFMLIEPSLDQVIEAAEKTRPLSFYDWLCFLLADKGDWVCVSNDRALRRQCISCNVAVMWEIEMLCLLVEAGGLVREQCKNIILSIKEKNPFFMTDSIVKNAFKRLNIDS